MTTLQLPLSIETKQQLKAGQKVLLSGIVYTARDAAHKRLTENLKLGEKAPFELAGATIFYVGPTPVQSNGLPGAAGPTTSSRMDHYTVPLLENGISAIIGKGDRSTTILDAMKKFKCIYFVGIGGAGALMAKSIKSMELVAYEDLGAEAIYKFEIEDMAVYVGYDFDGNSCYK